MSITRQPITSSVILSADDLCTILNVPAVQDALGFPAVTISRVLLRNQETTEVLETITVDFAMERIERPAPMTFGMGVLGVPHGSGNRAAPPMTGQAISNAPLTQDDLDAMDPVEMARASYADAARTLGVDVR